MILSKWNQSSISDDDDDDGDDEVKLMIITAVVRKKVHHPWSMDPFFRGAASSSMTAVSVLI